jgi:hypothetical protein
MTADEKGSTDVSELSRKRLLIWIKRARIKRAWIKPTWNTQAWIKDDSGVAALVLAAVIAVVAFTALTIFLNKFIGGRELTKAQSGASAQSKVLPAIYAFYLADTVDPVTHAITPAPHRLPCPDTKAVPDGADTASCSASGNHIGVIPWTALGLSRNDVIDGYGHFYTYVVSGDAGGVCESVDLNYSTTGAPKEFTGRQLTTSVLEARLTTQTTAGEGRKVPFAIIGHGVNGTGALSSSGSITPSPSKAAEQANAAKTLDANPPTTIFTGPANPDTTSDYYFDDQVLVPATADVQKVCAQLTPGGSINASIADSFNKGATTAANFGNVTSAGVGANGVNIQTSGSDSTNKVAAFAVTTGGGGAATSYLVTNPTNFHFDPLTRAVYAKATWRAGANGATFSIATRGSESDLTAGTDLFTTNGITFRFGATLQICNGDCTVPLNSGTGLTVSSGTLYTLEVYDNGSDVWMRISPAATPGTSATVRAANATGDTGGAQQVFFINSSTTATAEIDDVAVGFPMLAAETAGAITSYITSTGNGTSTGRLTLEAWVRPRALPSSGANGSIIAKWDTAAETSSSFRLRTDSNGAVYFDIASDGSSTTVEHFIGPSLTANTWSHIAVTYTYNNTADPTPPANAVADTETVTFFKNGDLVSSVTQNVTGTTVANTAAAGIHQTGVPDFYVGADLNGAAKADPFNGDIADVRVWKEARTANQIQTYFQSRLPADPLDVVINDLVVNWRLDSESLDPAAGLTFTTAAATGKGTAGTVNAASLVPTLALYFRPLSTTFCPSGSGGAIAGAYQCDFRTVGTQSITLPGSLLSVYAKIWGGGGGGYSVGGNVGLAGSGGFSAGRILRMGTSAIANLPINVIVGGGGAGSGTDAAYGGGGGGASALKNGTANSLVAGGGGGASYSAGANASVVGNIITALLTLLTDPLQIVAATTHLATFTSIPAGGDGDGGGGATVDVMLRAPDGSTNTCGGRDANLLPSGSNPPRTNSCEGGGGDPDALGGGGGAPSGGSLGGSSTAGAGGNGYAGTAPQIGAAGGGGGVIANASNVTTGGGGEAGGYTAPITIPYSPSFTVDPNAGYGFGGGGGAGYYDNLTNVPASTGVRITGATGAAGSTTAAGGATDFYYWPYGGTLQYPGRGGAIGASVNGSAGAVVLIW